MTENTATPARPRRFHSRTLLLVLSVLFVLLLYGAGYIVLPIPILSALHSKNCESALNWNSVYIRLYPPILQDQNLPAPIQECEVYLAAVSSGENGAWREAYDAYQAYLTAYPNGWYRQESHEQSGAMLMNIAQDQVEGQKYEEALSSLSLILSMFADTSVSAEAWTLVPQVYQSWGTAFREAGDFERAEQIFKAFQSWAQSNQKTEPETEARRELAATYLDWGMVLQSHGQYETALAILDLALAADSQSQFESAAEVRSGQRGIFVEWGNVLIDHNEFPLAVAKFDKAVSLTGDDSDNTARDALVDGRIQWAASLSDTEDFQAALAQLELAEAAALTDASKKSLDSAFSNTYLAFSNSSGSQARLALREAIDGICKQRKKPALPIFGLNQNSVHVGIQGGDAKLPEDLVAKTPGELHYVACVDVQNQVVESRRERQIVFKTSKGYYYVVVEQHRAKVLWEIRLFDSQTGKVVAETSLTGGEPPAFPADPYAGGGYTSGPPPTADQLGKWLQSAIK